MTTLGVDDFLEVKFYENKINGQSKGFCCVSLGSERSMQKVMEEMPKKELHSQLPVVSYPTRQALYQFESQSKTRPPPSGQGQGGPCRAREGRVTATAMTAERRPVTTSTRRSS